MSTSVALYLPLPVFLFLSLSSLLSIVQGQSAEGEREVETGREGAGKRVGEERKEDKEAGVGFSTGLEAQIEFKDPPVFFSFQ